MTNQGNPKDIEVRVTELENAVRALTGGGNLGPALTPTVCVVCYPCYHCYTCYVCYPCYTCSVCGPCIQVQEPQQPQQQT